MRMRFGSSRSVNWQDLSLDFLALVAGWLALTTVIVGSFLRGFAKRQKKPATRTAPGLCYDKARIDKESQFNTTLPASILSRAIIAQDCDGGAQFDDSVFDPERDYAQVLAEARMHVKESESWTHKSASSSKSTTQCKQSQEIDAYCHLQSGISKQNVGSRISTADGHKPATIWKHVLFWQRPKKAETQNVDCPFSTPQHPLSGTLHCGYYPTLKRGKSGPIYTDGLPATGPSNRCRKALSGPLRAIPFYGQDQTGSSYEALKRSSRPSSRAPSAPLYSVS